MIFSVGNLTPSQLDAYRSLTMTQRGMLLFAAVLRVVQGADDGVAYFEDVIENDGFKANHAAVAALKEAGPAGELALRTIFGDALRSRPVSIFTPEGRSRIMDSTGRKSGAPKQTSLSKSEAADFEKYRAAKESVGPDGVVRIFEDGHPENILLTVPGSAPLPSMEPIKR
jgi:hypothetical protein